jgi:hypothetical protein
MDPAEAAAVWKLRGVLHSLDSSAAIELLIKKVRETKSNAEFLSALQKNSRATGALSRLAVPSPECRLLTGTARRGSGDRLVRRSHRSGGSCYHTASVLSGRRVTARMTARRDPYT